MTAAQRDLYANLLSEPHQDGLDSSQSRDTWVNGLSDELREDSLFELEMLLRGLACLEDPRNQPGPPDKVPGMDHDFQEELRIVRAALARVLELTRRLLGIQARAYAFSRYVATSLHQHDGEPSLWLREKVSQESPRDSLFLLRNAITDIHELAESAARSGTVPAAVYNALVATIGRELARNAHFSPYADFSFRPEFDRIRDPGVLKTLDSIHSSAAHRVVALTFLSIYRGLHYLDLVTRYTSEGSTRLSWVVLASFRHDMRSLTQMLSQQAADAIADGFESELLAVRAAQITADQKALTRRARHLAALRVGLQRIGVQLAVETRLCFELDLPVAHGSRLDGGTVTSRIVTAAGRLRATLLQTAQTLCAEVDPRARPSMTLHRDEVIAYELELLRRQIWMFARIIRAFVAKADAVPEIADRWVGAPSLKFVRDFVSHYRLLGVPLVGLSSYPDTRGLASTLVRIRSVELPSRSTLEGAVEQCLALREHLEQFFVSLAQHGGGGPSLDKQRAAAALRIYLDVT